MVNKLGACAPMLAQTVDVSTTANVGKIGHLELIIDVISVGDFHVAAMQ